MNYLLYFLIVIVIVLKLYVVEFVVYENKNILSWDLF